MQEIQIKFEVKVGDEVTNNTYGKCVVLRRYSKVITVDDIIQVSTSYTIQPEKIQRFKISAKDLKNTFVYDGNIPF